MEIGILGGGFGIYGYLPASILNGYSVTTLSRYKSIIEKRPELKPYFREIKYVSREEDLFRCSNFLVIARDPQSQFDLLLKCAGKFEHLYLEKPLGVNPAAHRILLDRLSNKNQSFSLGYLAEFTEWFHVLNSKEISSLEFVWEVKVDEVSWKSKSFPDRGLLSYYGVHLIPVLERFLASSSPLIVESTKNKITIDGVSKDKSIKVTLVDGTDPKFKLSSTGSTARAQFNFELETPFGDRNSLGFPDKRIPLLQKYLNRNAYFPIPELSVKYELLLLKLLSLTN